MSLDTGMNSGHRNDAATEPNQHVVSSMGDLERTIYRQLWQASLRFRRRAAATKAARHSTSASASLPKSRLRGFGSYRHSIRAVQEDEEVETSFNLDRARHSASDSTPDTPARIVAGLLFARMFDTDPEMLEELRTGAPTILIDVADPEMLERLSSVWSEILYGGSERLCNVESIALRRRDELDALYFFMTKPKNAGLRQPFAGAAISALALALPIIAITPGGATHLPDVIDKAATHRVNFPRLDPEVIARTIRIVTGKPCRLFLDSATAASLTTTDLVVAIRFDRTPARCAAELRRLAALKTPTHEGRDIALADIHGIGEARTWVNESIADVEAWKKQLIPWDRVASSVCLAGPSGVGKTLVAQAYARHMGWPVFDLSYSKIQAIEDGHLGNCLNALRAGFEAARAQAAVGGGAVVMLDELDSYANRSGGLHDGPSRSASPSYDLYSRAVVNALLATIDGVAGRVEGLVLIAATNHLSACDPALLRPGRFDRIVRMGLPTVTDLQRMLRVRLGDDLAGDDLLGCAEAAVGMTGADIERVVKDARRSCRRAGRPLELADVALAIGGRDCRPASLRWRHCIHEAGHILMNVIHFGRDGVVANAMVNGSRGGMTMRTDIVAMDGTYEDYQRVLQVLLAGRMAEEVVLRAASHGAGGGEAGSSVRSDLDQASELAAAMAGCFGLLGRHSLAQFSSRSQARDLLRYPEVRAAVNRELEAAAAACEVLLADHRAELLKVAATLNRNGRIDGTEVGKILDSSRELESQFRMVDEPNRPAGGA